MERLVIISGLSGSGKTLAADCLEDLGFFCVDNLPVALIPPFCELIQRSGSGLAHAALVVDARELAFLHQFPETLRGLREKQVPVQLLFFECSDDVLKRRFSESRRPHPMTSPDGTLEDALQSERQAMAPLRDLSDRIIDTSQFTSHELRAFLKNAYGEESSAEGPNVNVLSFGFKYGVPAEVDLLFDVRFLPNPYFVEGLRELTGRTNEVQSFLEEMPESRRFFDKLTDLLDFLVPLYRNEGKAYLTVGLGCTGGKHRSVALAEWLGEHLERHGLPFSISHRDLGRE
jgi:UPF0042 nucleotide-binding protein